MTSLRALASLGLGALLLAQPTVAAACGSSGPDGVSACSLAEYAEAQRPRWRLGVSGVYTSTVLSFGSFHAGETRYATLAELAYAPTSRLTLSVGLGAAEGGRLLAPDGAHDFTPGIAAGLGVSYRVLDGATPLGRGFVVASANLSYTGAATQRGDEWPRPTYNAFDLRAGVAFGFTWARTVSLYGLGRVFGGPVYWTYQGNDVTGTDTHHYQLGGGLAVLVARRVDLFVEGVPLGEQAVAAGASVAF